MAITISITSSNISGGDSTINRTDISVPVGEFKSVIENLLNGAQDSEAIRFAELGSNPTTPATGKWKLYFKSDGLYTLDDAAAAEKISGIVPMSRGGLGEDVSAFSGLVQISGGDASALKIDTAFSGKPNANDDTGDGYSIGSLVVNGNRDEAFIATKVTSGAARWVRLGRSRNHFEYRGSGASVYGVGAANPTIANSPANANNDGGSYIDLPSTGSSGNIAGFVSPTFNLLRLFWFPDFVVRVRTPATITNLRYWIGLTSADVTNVDTLAGATEFLGFRYSTVAGDTGWRPVARDGSTQNVGTAIGTVAPSTDYELRVYSEGGTAYFAVNDTVQAGGTNQPDYSTDLGFVCRVIPTSASARSIYFNQANFDYIT